MGAEVILDRISKFFKDYQGKIVTALNEVSIQIEKEELIAVVGETGSGKTTLGRISAGLVYPSIGKVTIDGNELNKKSVKRGHWRRVQFIHQDPYSALDSMMTVAEIMERPLQYINKINRKEERIMQIRDYLPKLGLEKSVLTKYVRELSGGERQRILIGRAFIVNPDFLVADEPTTMLDFIHRNEIIQLIKSLKETYKTTMLLITHDLGLASEISGRLLVMYKGKIVESGPKKNLVLNPAHPYTLALNAAVPDKIIENKGRESYFWKAKTESNIFQGIGKGCDYVGRCPFAHDRCSKEAPKLVEIERGHMVSCFYPQGS